MTWLDQFPELSDLGDSDKVQLIHHSSVLAVSKGTVVYGPGKTPTHLLLLLGGTVRVQQVSEYGREIVLYRVRSGESCILTTSCLLSQEEYSAQGVAESEVEAVTIPKQTFDELIAHSLVFRQFVFAEYSKRISELCHVIEDVAFQRVDVRLAEKLIELAGVHGEIQITHQQLAAELGTAREVVSRQLSEFQRRNWIELARGSIQVKDRVGLECLHRV